MTRELGNARFPLLKRSSMGSFGNNVNSSRAIEDAVTSVAMLVSLHL